MENMEDFLEEIKKRDYINCTNGKPHDFDEKEEWVDKKDSGPDNGFWRHSFKCKNCDIAMHKSGNYCSHAKDKKHNYVESYITHKEVTSHKVECVKCGITAIYPVLINGARIKQAKSTKEMPFPDGTYLGLHTHGTVKMLFHRKVNCESHEFTIDLLSKAIQRPVMIEIIDKVAHIYQLH